MLTTDGDLYTLGCGEQGQLGRVPELFANRGGRQGLGKCLTLVFNRATLPPGLCPGQAKGSRGYAFRRMANLQCCLVLPAFGWAALAGACLFLNLPAAHVTSLGCAQEKDH